MPGSVDEAHFGPTTVGQPVFIGLLEPFSPLELHSVALILIKIR